MAFQTSYLRETARLRKEVREYDKYLSPGQVLSCSIVQYLVVFPLSRTNAASTEVARLEADQFMKSFAKLGIEHSVNHGIYEAVHVA